MVNASCLPSIILDKHIPVLEKTVNDILTPMTSFQIKITIKGSTIVFRHIKSTGTDITISACSGYEYFMLNLALKMSLAKFGYIPFPSFISIDEGWDVVSESNYSKLQKMFDTLYSIYRNIIVISHLPKVQYMLESFTGTSITIQNVNGISTVS
jgi:DNA repair exonuclease SbcCD ATPase subunit